MIVLWLVGILTGIGLVVLFVPVRIHLDLGLDTDEAEPVAARWRVRWTFLSWQSGRAKARPPEKGERPPARGAGWRPFVAAFRTPGFPARCGRAVREAGRALRPASAYVRARVGFDDPAATGMFMGAVSSVAAVPRPAGWDVAITPDFSSAVLAGHANLSWSIPPARVLWPMLTLVAAPVTWRATRAAWAARRT
jgi:hypothetical protein